jgi:hypothetical protein
MPVFDPRIFDPAIFDTGSAPRATTYPPNRSITYVKIIKLDKPLLKLIKQYLEIKLEEKQ